MKKIALFLAIPILMLSCENEIDVDSNDKEKTNDGGTFRVALSIAPKTLNPRSIIDFYSASAASQIYEGLVKFNPKTLKPEAAIASKYEITDDLKTFTFKLRSDVKFHDSPIFKDGKGRAVTAMDVKKSFEYYCNPNIKGDPIAYLSVFKNAVVGVDEYFNGEASEVSGIKVNGNEVSIQLINSDVNFINKLCMVSAYIVPVEAIEQGRVNDGVGSGPFILNTMNDSEVILLRNDQYYGKNDAGVQLPILDSLIFKIDDDKEHQLAEFRAKNLNVLVGLPPNKIVEVLQQNIKDFNNDPPKYELIGVPELSTSYITVNMLKPYFQNEKLRKAISMAINREVIMRDDLKNQAYNADGVYGITPPLPIIKDYDFKGIKERSAGFNPEMAKQLLAEAGYPNGKGFPSIRLEFVESTVNSKVANSIMKQLKKNLNVNIQIESVSFEQKMKDAREGTGDLYLDAWIADYASPQTFLSNYYGKTIPTDPAAISPINVSRFNNESFDDNYGKACSTLDEKERLAYFSEAEKILTESSGVIVLWYAEEHKITHSDVRDFKSNALKLMNFSNVYFKERVAGEKKGKKK